MSVRTKPGIRLAIYAFKGSPTHRLFLDNELGPSDAWCDPWEDYADRKLTHFTDRLPALSGLAHVVRKDGVGLLLASSSGQMCSDDVVAIDQAEAVFIRVSSD